MGDVTESPQSIEGQVAHDGVDAGDPVKIGHKAAAHGANPTAVAEADRTDWLSNRHGIPWVVGGHPNIVSREFVATTAQTDTSMVGTISPGVKVVVTSIEAMVDKATTVDVGVRVGFGATTVPAEPTDGNQVAGMILSHPGIAAGSGVVRGSGSGILGIGADGEELRITSEVPTGGKLRVLFSYYTIES
jgi:hypothetical protein